MDSVLAKARAEGGARGRRAAAQSPGQKPSPALSAPATVGRRAARKVHLPFGAGV